MPETITAIIPCYNAATFLRETVQSVLRQTVQPQEVLVIDDGSTDESADIVASYEAPIRLIRQDNQGVAAARNRGIQEARGEWLAFLDADDRWEPEKLEKQIQAIRPGVVCVHTNYYSFGAVTKQRDVSNIPETERYTAAGIVRHRPFNTSTLLVRHNVSPEFPTWAPQAAEDLIYLLELTARGDSILIPEPLVGYRRHQQSYRGRTANVELQRFRFVVGWLDRREDLNSNERTDVLRSALYWLVKEAKRAKQARDFVTFDKLCEELQPYQHDLQVAELLAERRLPGFFYRMHDVARWTAHRARALLPLSARET